jgi:hypothetical protein
MSRLPPQGVRKASIEVTLFDIEKDGDPRISWYMYYDFVVTKNEAFFQLQPGYLPTKIYPRRQKSEPLKMFSSLFYYNTQSIGSNFATAKANSATPAVFHTAPSNRSLAIPSSSDTSS